MSFLGRLFGVRTSSPPPGSVVVDSEVAAALTAGGEPLDRAVDAALRAHLAAVTQPRADASPAGVAPGAEAPPEGAAAPEAADRMPFWLQRDAEQGAPLEDELRERIIHRREADSESRQ